MPHIDLAGLGLYLAYFIVTGAPAVLLKVFFDIPFELIRKIYHFVITLSIFPLVTFFSTWQDAVLAVILFTLIAYPILARLEHAALYRRIAVERKGGEFKSSLLVVQMSMALLLFVFWGLLGEEWKYIAVVAVMAWGFGDAAAALVGKAVGRHRIRNPHIQGPKTYEGTFAMFFISGLAVFLTLLLYAHQPWYVSLAIALLVAPVCAAVELFTNGGMDTLTVPISTGLVVLFFLSLFRVLGA
ncbi:MAG: phosphatidate cytidylyltransferase [Chloroflexi bacterium]|jgi:dolichol kinase|nr:phosphatidate cytidylyltransferase [Chloroflexota bacterium]